MIFTYTRERDHRDYTYIYSDNEKQTEFLMNYHKFFNGHLYFTWTTKWNGWDEFSVYRQEKDTLQWKAVRDYELDSIVEKIKPDWEAYAREF